ncbi:MAG: TetR/AcrR family transcriptional regulator [Desulfobacterales bacterium]|nr:TetR/AcrR family transcriptional regulator [Desulfobacterales bacterium]
MSTKGEQTREKILDEARLLFKQKGFGATTINDLLNASGTTKGNLYFHFSDKEAVGLEVLRREQRSFYNFLEQIFNGKSAAVGLDNFFHKALEKQRQQGFVGGCLFGNTALEASDTSPLFAGLVQEVFAEWMRLFEEKIAAAQAVEQIRSDIPAGELAELVVATVEGGIMQSRLQKSADPLKRSLETLRRVLGLKVN